MISPIESFPGKLLVAIAAAAQEDHAPDEAFLSPTLKPEWALSQTCARFREVIVGAPVLWTFIECDLACDDSVTRMYLEHSRGCKIWAEVYHGPYYPGGNSVVLAERFHQIVSHFNRIWRLRILVNTEVSMALAEVLWAPLRDIAAPDLQHLEIKYEMRDYIVRESGRPVTLFSAGAPRLTLVKLVNFIPFPMPWLAQLKHLEMWCTNAVKERLFVDIAAQCSSLAHLNLDIRDVSVEMGHQFHIPSLKSLHITISDNEDHDFLPHALDIFNTPALIELMIDSAHGDQIFPFVDSISLWQASFPALVSLSFIKCHTCSCEYHDNPPHTISAPPIALFPALSSLTLINQCFTAQLVKNILGS